MLMFAERRLPLRFHAYRRQAIAGFKNIVSVTSQLYSPAMAHVHLCNIVSRCCLLPLNDCRFQLVKSLCDIRVMFANRKADRLLPVVGSPRRGSPSRRKLTIVFFLNTLPAFSAISQLPTPPSIFDNPLAHQTSH